MVNKDYGSLLLTESVFRTDNRREIRGLINELKLEIKLQKVWGYYIPSVIFDFWWLSHIRS